MNTMNCATAHIDPSTQVKISVSVEGGDFICQSGMTISLQKTSHGMN